MPTHPLSPGKFWGLRRLADADGRFKMLAVDQRPPIKNLIKDSRGVDEAPYEDVSAVKQALVAELAPYASAVLLDPHVAYPQGVHLVSPAQGIILTLEDSIFVETPEGRLSAEIQDWNVPKIKRIGGDAVKVLAWYRPDAGPSVLLHQKDFVKRVGDACAKYDLPYVFELLVYPLARDAHQTTDYIEHQDKRPDRVLESVETFADATYGVDLFKLESPIPAADVPDPDTADAAATAATQRLFNRLGTAAGRPWVMLSAGAGMEAFRRVCVYAYRAGASGYLAGRAIWWQAFQAFPDVPAMRDQLRREGAAYMQSLNALTDAHATPWTEHPLYAPQGPQLAGRGTQFRESTPAFEPES